MELNRGNMKKLMLLIAFGIVFYLGLTNLYRLQSFFGMVAGLFAPILFGFAVAYVFNVLLRVIEARLFPPLDRRFQRVWPKLRRPASITLSLLAVIGSLVLIALIIVPDLVSTATSLAGSIPALLGRAAKQYHAFAARYPDISRHLSSFRVDWASVSQMLTQNVREFANYLVNDTLTLTTNLFNGFVSAILGFVIAVNILFSKETLERQLRKLLYAFLPRDYPHKMIRVLKLTDQAFSDFIAGQCIGAVILGILCFLGMLLFRFPYALLISVLIAVFALLPILGQIFGTIIGALLILTVSPIQALWFIVYVNVLQQLNGSLVYPKIVGSKIGLPTLWVLVAITLGGSLFGIPGMLVSIPIFSVARTLLSESVERRLRKKREEPEHGTYDTPKA